MVDYVTKNAEVIPLRSMTTAVVVWNLWGSISMSTSWKKFFRIREPNFMSTACRSFGMSVAFSTYYHPELMVEHFNKNAQVFDWWPRCVIKEEGGITFPDLLFACSQVPQKDSVFSSFELLFCHSFLGPLTLVKEGWEGNPRKVSSRQSGWFCAGTSNEDGRAHAQGRQSIIFKPARNSSKRWHGKKTTKSGHQEGQEVFIIEPRKLCAFENKRTDPYTALK